MKTNQKNRTFQLILVLIIVFFISGTTMAQTDATADSTNQQNTEEEQKTKKKRDSFKVYGGINMSGLNVDSDRYESQMEPGFLVGASYKRGKFFYWEVGARYNKCFYNFKSLETVIDTTGMLSSSFNVSAIEIPIIVGINLTSFVDRLVGVRIFVGAVPSFAISVNDDKGLMDKDDINSFNFLANIGLGIDVAFLFIEVGGNVGFTDLLVNDIQSNPYQGYATLGFRF